VTETPSERWEVTGQSLLVARFVLLALVAVSAPVSDLRPWTKLAYALALLAWIPEWFASARPGRPLWRVRRWADRLTVLVLVWAIVWAL